MLKTPELYVETLSRVALFASLTHPELQEIARLMSKCAVEPGRTLFNEGDACEGLYVVESGALRIFKTAASGREQVLAIERDGGIVAELPVFDDGPYPASCCAIAPTTLLFLSKSDFKTLCLEHPALALKVLKNVGHRLRNLVGLIEELSFTTVRQRLASILLKLAESEGKPGATGIAIDLPPNHEIGSRIGTVRELVSRNLSRFQQDGLIQMDGKHVVIVDPERLRDEAESEG
jgi:CRP/FNR family transcriptional regulator, cyclic AMP receptor protein